MELRHRQPCRECPWRRQHAAGWLGGYQPQRFTQQVLRDGPPLPCHLTIPEQGVPASAVCAGSLVFMLNSCKLPLDPELAAMRAQVTADHVAVFSNAGQFLAHHQLEESET